MVADLTLAELNDRIGIMSDRDKKHFRTALTLLLRCYGEDTQGQAVIIHSSKQSPTIEFMSMNCNDMEAADLLNSMADFMNAVQMQDAPPKEQFN